MKAAEKGRRPAQAKATKELPGTSAARQKRRGAKEARRVAKASATEETHRKAEAKTATETRVVTQTQRLPRRRTSPEATQAKAQGNCQPTTTPSLGGPHDNSCDGGPYP
jgi:hypothetical protein